MLRNLCESLMSRQILSLLVPICLFRGGSLHFIVRCIPTVCHVLNGDLLNRSDLYRVDFYLQGR